MSEVSRSAQGGTRILEHPGAGTVLVLERSKLVVTSGPDAGKEIALERTTLRVGTDPSCDLILADSAVSARHFELVLDPNGCLLRDRGSTNGTFVDGYRTVGTYLKHGSEIVVGNSTLSFQPLAGEIHIPLASNTNFGDLLGHSAPMRAAFAVLERAAKTDSTVLVMAESGTGKELAARALHERSARRDKPYVVIDCGGIPATLIESHLFGHTRGAFTGAVQARGGAFEEADGGTLVLDEIGELPLELQPKLLRAVEARTVQRVGETSTRSIDVRLIACTNRNLEEEVRAGRFRQDLFFRLSVISVHLPPLRERREEIPRLVRHFMTKLAGDAKPREISPAVMELLMGHSWPGNVRELRNVVERLVVLRDLDPATYLPKAQPARGSSPPPMSSTSAGALPFHEAKRQWTEQFEREYLERLLAELDGNISEVARVAGLSRQTCYRLLHKYGLERD